MILSAGWWAFRRSGSITASYATGAADGGDGDGDYVGGLVGVQEESSSITASYATGDADGGDGNDDNVGGLVGLQYGSSITASYARGDADGGDGDDDYVGGLVGYQEKQFDHGELRQGRCRWRRRQGSCRRAGGLAGKCRRAGGLAVGGGSITASYGFGSSKGELRLAKSREEVEGSAGSTKPPGVSTADQLTADNAGDAWDSADSNTLGAWNFVNDAKSGAELCRL